MIPSIAKYVHQLFHPSNCRSCDESPIIEPLNKQFDLKKKIFDECLQQLKIRYSSSCLLETLAQIPEEQIESKESKLFFKSLKEKKIFAHLSSSKIRKLFEKTLKSFPESLSLQLLNLNIPLKSQSTNIQEILHLSAQYGKVEVIKKLISKGLPVNGRDGFAKTPLHWSCTFGHFDASKLLLDMGACIDAEDHKSATPLIIATKFLHNELVQYLVLAGANINMKNDEGNSALHLACLTGNKELALLLLSKGAEYLIANQSGFTPKSLAIFRGHKEIANLIPDDVYTNEFIYRKLIAHIHAIDGESNFNGLKFPLDGAYPSFMHQKMQEYFSDFVSHTNCDLTEDEIHVILQAFEKTYKKRNPEEILESIQSGDLTIVTTGWRSHAINLVFCNDLFAICNGGDGIPADGKTISAFAIKKEAWNTQLLEEILYSTHKIAKTRIPLFYTKIPQECTLGKTPDLEWIEHFSNKEIKVGICSWAACKIALRVSLFFGRLSRKSSLEDISLFSNHLIHVTKEFSLYAKIKILIEYLEEGSKKDFYLFDRDLVRRSLEKVHMRLEKTSSPPSFIIEQFKHLHKKYAEMTKQGKKISKTKTPSSRETPPIRAKKRFKN